MQLLDDESWLSMRVAGDWVFYLHILRGGKIAYQPEALNFFRRYNGSAAELTYKQEAFYREVGFASRAVATLYDVPLEVLDRCHDSCKKLYFWRVPTGSSDEFERWFNPEASAQAPNSRSLNIMISTMGFYPGGAEILPIRMANEFKRQGHSVLFFSCGLAGRQDGVRRMLRNDVPVIETSKVEDVREFIADFGIEALNTHQWHIQKYPLRVPDVFDGLRAHVASLHGMIEHGEAFEATEEQLRGADSKVTTWVYTAEKNLGPFFKFGLGDKSSGRFVKLPNGIQAPDVTPIPRARMNIPEDAFLLCCVSRAIPDKGWAETIEAVASARAISSQDIRLILVGNGPVYDEYCRIGTPDFVYLAGFSNNSVGYYAAADMGIMLSKFKSESFPLTILDCLFAGKPYIASDIGDIRNMLTVDHDVAGSIIELDNWEIPVETAAQDIAAFASDPQRYLNASALVAAAANRCRIDAVVSRYVELFEAERNGATLGERSRVGVETAGNVRGPN
jgi:glycosyltransferase involved in cell wall biosynthesis